MCKTKHLCFDFRYIAKLFPILEYFKRLHRMKIRLTIILITLFQLYSYSQDTFTSRKGSKFFPGHLDIVITVDNKNVRYELFNHWYSHSYAELRQITIPLESLNDFNQKNDSIKIISHKGKVKLIDKKYRLSRNIKHKKLCASISTMRKISFAYKQSLQYKDIRHFELYNQEDLVLSEEDFKKKVIEKLQEKIK